MVRNGALGGQTVVIGPRRNCRMATMVFATPWGGRLPAVTTTTTCPQHRGMSTVKPSTVPSPYRLPLDTQWPWYVSPKCTPYPLRRDYVQGIFQTDCHHLFFLMTTCHLTRYSHYLAVRSLWPADFWLRTADSLVQTCT